MGRPSTMPRLLEALEAGPGTQRDLAQRSGLSSGAVSRHLAALLAEYPRRVRIDAWRRNEFGAPFEAVYAMGAGRSARKPKPMTEAQKSRRYRQRHLATGAWQERNDRMRARRQADRLKPRRDAMIAALFGDPR